MIYWIEELIELLLPRVVGIKKTSELYSRAVKYSNRGSPEMVSGLMHLIDQKGRRYNVDIRKYTQHEKVLLARAHLEAARIYADVAFGKCIEMYGREGSAVFARIGVGDGFWAGADGHVYVRNYKGNLQSSGRRASNDLELRAQKAAETGYDPVTLGIAREHAEKARICIKDAAVPEEYRRGFLIELARVTTQNFATQLDVIVYVEGREIKHAIVPSLLRQYADKGSPYEGRIAEEVRGIRRGLRYAERVAEERKKFLARAILASIEAMKKMASTTTDGSTVDKSNVDSPTSSTKPSSSISYHEVYLPLYRPPLDLNHRPEYEPRVTKPRNQYSPKPPHHLQMSPSASRVQTRREKGHIGHGQRRNVRRGNFEQHKNRSVKLEGKEKRFRI
ncbi:MAG: hypothetical protein J4428_03030 [Candidatus Aenigmarchaeota archaeon]|nr:hypothetical protein [Candidatus Aenigmarchaeota archaeon]